MDNFILRLIWCLFKNFSKCFWLIIFFIKNLLLILDWDKGIKVLYFSGCFIFGIGFLWVYIIGWFNELYIWFIKLFEDVCFNFLVLLWILDYG